MLHVLRHPDPAGGHISPPRFRLRRWMPVFASLLGGLLLGTALFGTPPAAATGAHRPALHNLPTPTPTAPAMDMPMGGVVAQPTPVMTMPNNPANAEEAGHSHSTTAANTPSAETKGWVVGTLGVVNGGIILTAAVLKRKTPKPARSKPVARPDR